MNDDQSNTNLPNDEGLNAEDLCIAAMLRACADGELCRVECDRLKRYLQEHPEAEAQVEFEQALKKCCDRVMKTESKCPDSLRAKIETMAGDSMTASGIDQSNQSTRKASFWIMSPMMSAMAAVLILAGGALIWQSSTLITQGGGFGINQTTPVAYAERVGNFVAREHMRCCNERAAAKKLAHDEIGASIEYFSDRFEHSVITPASLGDNTEINFFGGGDCNIPATKRSGHLRFDAVGADGERVSLSLFVAPDPGLLELEAGTTYLLESSKCSEQGANLFAWVSDGVMYLLVSEADESMCATVRDMMNAPGELRPL